MMAEVLGGRKPLDPEVVARQQARWSTTLVQLDQALESASARVREQAAVLLEAILRGLDPTPIELARIAALAVGVERLGSGRLGARSLAWGLLDMTRPERDAWVGPRRGFHQRVADNGVGDWSVFLLPDLLLQAVAWSNVRWSATASEIDAMAVSIQQEISGEWRVRVCDASLQRVDARLYLDAWLPAR